MKTEKLLGRYGFPAAQDCCGPASACHDGRGPARVTANSKNDSASLPTPDDRILARIVLHVSATSCSLFSLSSSLDDEWSSSKLASIEPRPPLQRTRCMMRGRGSICTLTLERLIFCAVQAAGRVEGSGLLGGPAQIQFWLGIDAGIDASHSGSFPTGHTEKAGPFTLFTRNAPQAT